MLALRQIALLTVMLLLGACASLRLGSDFNAGRQAMLRGDNGRAMAHFQSVAQQDPNYTYGTAYPQGVLSYLGRTQYLSGNLPEARKTLEQALSSNHQQDDLTRVYLGLTLAREGDRAQGLKQIEAGMKGYYDWLEYVTQAHRFSFGQYWDPAGDLRSSIRNDLAMLSTREADMPTVIASTEELAKRMEEEGDKASRDESRDQWRDGDNDSGDTQP
jgi:tetratricopeptide (TPR) repeat protein